jgi:hypothetical protein
MKKQKYAIVQEKCVISVTGKSNYVPVTGKIFPILDNERDRYWFSATESIGRSYCYTFEEEADALEKREEILGRSIIVDSAKDPFIARSTDYVFKQEIIFDLGYTVLTYKVEHSHLSGKGTHNSHIFEELGIDDPNLFCSRVYGYSCGRGDFPTFNYSDATAAKAIIRALHEECAKYRERKVKRTSKLKYKFRDSVFFQVGDKQLEYRVQNTHLKSSEGNSQIFRELGIWESKEDFCTKHYGYEASQGCFPACKHNDMQALNSVIEALHKECLIYNSSKCNAKTSPYLEEKKLIVHLGTFEAEIQAMERLRSAIVASPYSPYEKFFSSKPISKFTKAADELNASLQVKKLPIRRKK